MSTTTFDTVRLRAQKYLRANHSNPDLALEHVILDAIHCERERLARIACASCSKAIRANRPP